MHIYEKYEGKTISFRFKGQNSQSEKKTKKVRLCRHDFMGSVFFIFDDNTNAELIELKDITFCEEA